MDVLLIAGLWLRNTVWNGVAGELERLGHRPVPVALPGVDDGSTTATLADQLDAVVAAIDGADRPMVVGHSAACTLAWMGVDRRPDQVGMVALIGGFPAASGDTYADFFEPVHGVMAFPGWGPFEGADSADLDAEARTALASDTVPVPERVSRGVVSLTDDRRFQVPTVVICPEFNPEQAKGWIAGGDVPELAAAKHLSFVDIDTGHWPMVTAPAELAAVLSDAASAH
ncbi:MAG: alpha/beta hydrolase [Acidimicrobiia bacterium]